ncbi:angiotensin-converting enzyme-like isoform X2 [Rhipicephalus microplus]|uniref:angiotensin-converting enzyme-like isoform X2 n=1 Tax=Rhipicephalus microplus TaxID=6941 RepID=UPI003F6D1982
MAARPKSSAADRLVAVALLATALYATAAADNFDTYLATLSNVSALIKDEAMGVAFIEGLNDPYTTINNVDSSSSWDYATNITDYNQNMSNKVSTEVSKMERQFGITAKRFDWHNFKNDSLKRLFRHVATIGLAALPDDKLENATSLSSKMAAIYGSTKVTVGKDKDLPLEPDLTRNMKEVGNYDKLLQTWLAWHNAVGTAIKQYYIPYIKLSNEAASLDGYDNLKSAWLSDYETENMTEIVDKLWEELSPLYKKLHAYVRMKLKEIYPGRLPEDGTIPAHLLGNMWAQEWGTLYPHLTMEDKPLDISKTMVEEKWDAQKMFHAAEDFFTSLGLDNMTSEFWSKSILTKPKDREIQCHASAWNMYNGDDFRIKMCTDPSIEQLRTVHHEMGHIEYYMQYKHLHVLLQEGANEGFHEAVGDLIALSVATKTHYEKLNLLKPTDKYNAVDLLLMSALDKIAFLPFGYLLDKWRWTIFTGETPFDKMNEKFWEYRIKYQGVSPPVKRNESFFDGGAKYHVALHVPYLRYFVAFILQFQFHEHLCTVAKKMDEQHPFHECDIYGEKAAGDVLKKGLSLGRSKPWPDVLEIMAGTRQMSAVSLKKYYEPLEKWLDERIKNEVVGWDKANVQDYMGMPSFANKVDFSAAAVLASIGVILFCWKNISL